MAVAAQKAQVNRQAQPAGADALAAEIKAQMDEAWPARIYLERILPLRTRSYQLPPVNGKREVEVQHTLLGVELKIGRRRLSCPDLATARYLAVFARFGCAAVAVPYDITRTSPLADELESSWQRMLLLIAHAASGHTQAFRARVQRLLINAARAEIERAGAGTPVPQFNQNTKQRPRKANTSK